MIEWWFYVYLALGAISLALLILMLILGGFDLELGESGPDIDVGGGVGGGDMGMFSIPMILSFLALFGGIGAILTFVGMVPVFTPFISGGVSAIFATVIFLVMNHLLKIFQSDSTVSYRKLVGQKGSVTIPIHPESEGQVVVVTKQRGRTLIPAVSRNKIPNNASIVVTGMRGDAVTVVTVTEWRKMRSKKKMTIER
ncbi:MAG: hypothetical protein U9R75_07795 [Candidatus Thermoplasmatota archaeon]|nr:hypothetical protein [Candidatus Thermoplasmatota archaeon]